MTEQNPKPSLTDFMNSISGMTKEEANNIISKAESVISDQEIKEAQRGKAKIRISDFNHPMVKPFACGHELELEKNIMSKKDGKAIYEVFTRSNNSLCLQHGGNILNYFGNDPKAKLSFYNKIDGSRIKLNYNHDVFTVSFKFLEIEVPEEQVAIIAKQLNKKPNDIIAPKEITEKEI